MIAFSSRLKRAACAASILVTISGCAGPSKTSQGPVFFPPAPNLPRVQYLMGISTSEDVEEKESSFSILSVGGQQQKKVRSIFKPYGVTAAAGKIYVADLSGQLVVVDLPNKSFETMKGDNGAGKLKKPVSVAVDNLGFVYVADVGRKEIVVFDSKGEYLKSLGSELDMNPSTVAVSDENVYILDTKKGIIRVLDRQTGVMIKEIGRSGDQASSLDIPITMVMDPKGVIRVTNIGNGKVMSYDRDGHFLGAFGGLGDNFGEFSRPKGIAADGNGYLYVVDSAFQNVQVLTEKGRILMFFGGVGLPAGGMNLPTGVSLSTDNLAFYQKFADKNFELEQIILVANQFGTPKIGLYGFGKQRGVDYDKEYKRIQQDRETKAREGMEEAKKKEEQKKQ